MFCEKPRLPSITPHLAARPEVFNWLTKIEFQKMYVCNAINMATKRHDLRRTAITRGLDQGLSYRQVQMMSGHRDPKTAMRYDHQRETLDQNAVNHLFYE